MTEPHGGPDMSEVTESALTESTLARLIGIFNVVPSESEPGRFTGRSDDGGGRNVVDGSQLLAQSIVAASKALPGRTARSAHALFVAAAHPAKPLDFTVMPVRAGRCSPARSSRSARATGPARPAQCCSTSRSPT